MQTNGEVRVLCTQTSAFHTKVWGNKYIFTQYLVYIWIRPWLFFVPTLSEDSIFVIRIYLLLKAFGLEFLRKSNVFELKMVDNLELLFREE